MLRLGRLGASAPAECNNASSATPAGNVPVAYVAPTRRRDDTVTQPAAENWLRQRRVSPAEPYKEPRALRMKERSETTLAFAKGGIARIPSDADPCPHRRHSPIPL